MRRGFSALASMVAALGCAPQSGFGRATTLDPGKHRPAVGIEASVFNTAVAKENSVPVPWFQSTAAYHLGAADGLELGVRGAGFHVPNVLTTVGGGADVKVQIDKPRRPSAAPDIAAGLALGYHHISLGGAGYHVMGGTLPVLFGFNLGRHQLTLGPRVADYVVASYGQNPIHAFYAGGGAGFSIRLKERFDLTPEVVVMYSPLSFNGESQNDARTGVAAIQLGLSGAWELAW